MGAFVIVVLFLFISIIIDSKKPREDFIIEGFNKIESRLIRSYKNHLDDIIDEHGLYCSLSNQTTMFYLPSDLEAVDIDKVVNYINMSPEFYCVVDELTVKYNKSKNKVNWYRFTYSRKHR